MLVGKKFHWKKSSSDYIISAVDCFDQQDLSTVKPKKWVIYEIKMNKNF